MFKSIVETTWKWLLSKIWETGLSGLVASLATLWDFQGFASTLNKVWPIFGALLQIFALAGAVVFSIVLIKWAVPLAWSMRPSGRFGKLYPMLAHYRDSYSSDMIGTIVNEERARHRLKEIAEKLHRFEVQTPSLDSNKDDLWPVWREFLSDIAPKALHNDLRSARRLNPPC